VKRIILSVLLIVATVALYGCTKMNPPTQPSAELGVPQEDITNVLLSGSIDVNGVYYETDENGTYKEAGGEPREYYKEFTGNFTNIKDVAFDENSETGEIVALFTANIENAYYKITERQGIQAFLKRNNGNIIFVSSNIVDDTPAFIRPMFEFNKDYILQKNSEITFSIPGNQYKDEYIYSGLNAEFSDLYGKDTGGVYLIKFNLSKDTVESIEIAPGNKNTPFRMTSPKIILALKNGLSISTNCDIYFNINQNNENKKGADFWNADFSDSFYSWRLES